MLHGTSRHSPRLSSRPFGMRAMPVQKPNRSDPRINRRKVLMGTAAALQVPLVSPAHPKTGDKPGSQATEDDHEPRYRETEHIRTFYDRSRF